MSEQTKQTFEKLLAPFPANDIEWRAGATTADKTKAMAVAYITSRAVMNRLDEVVGPENWQDSYQPAPSGGIMCGLSIRVKDEWVTKYDGADNTDIEAVKGGFSDAFKRAAVKWGIGRYLYNLDGIWVPCETRGKSVVLKYMPTLPAWALPAGEKPAKQAATPKSNGGQPADEAYGIDRTKMTLETAEAVLDSEGKRYGDATKEDLGGKLIGLRKALKKLAADDPKRNDYQFKLDAAETILAARQ